MRKLAAGALLALGAVGAGALRRRSARKSRHDVYYDDGAMLSLPPGTPETTTALARATDALRAAGQA